MDKTFKTIMEENIAELNVAIEYCKHDFAYMEAEYNNVFPPGIVGHDLALDIAMQSFKQEHQQFELLCNNRVLILETETAMDELIAQLNLANERCKDQFAAMEAAYVDVIQFGIVENNWALGIAMGNLKRAHWYMEWECYTSRNYLMTAGQQVAPNANAVQPTAAESVVANVSEEHNTAAIAEGTGEYSRAAREEIAEGNSSSSASEETVENN